MLRGNRHADIYHRGISCSTVKLAAKYSTFMRTPRVSSHESLSIPRNEVIFYAIAVSHEIYRLGPMKQKKKTTVKARRNLLIKNESTNRWIARLPPFSGSTINSLSMANYLTIKLGSTTRAAPRRVQITLRRSYVQRTINTP